MNDIITPQSITTLSIASTAVFMTCNVIYYVFNFNPKVLGLILSFITSYVISEITKMNLAQFYNIFIVFLNGILIYATAVGINAVTSKHGPPPPSGPGGGYSGGGTATKTKTTYETKEFFRSWF